MWARYVNAALGIWLMAAPAVLGFEGSAAATNYRIVGPIITSFAVIAITDATRPARRVNLVAGLSLLVTPWVVGFASTTATLNAVAVGAVVALLSLVRGPITDEFAGGWSTLWPPTEARGEHQRRLYERN